MDKLSQFFVVGTNHRCAPVTLREKIAFSQEGVRKALAVLRSGEFLGESAILSTCNRIEVYGVSEAKSGIRERILGFLSGFHGIEASLFEGRIYFYQGEKAIRHLFCVTSGFDSMVVGENEILGQVRESFREAFLAGNTGTFLHAVFESALRNAKRIKQETKTNQGAMSVSSVAVNLLRKIYKDLKDRNILVLGTGKMSGLALKKLAAAKPQSLWVAGRCFDRSSRLANDYGACPISWEEWKGFLAHADAVISSTAAPHAVILRSVVERAMESRNGRPLFIIDMAVPRDTEPGVGSVPGVSLYDMDSLQKISEANRRTRSAELSRCGEIIGKQVEDFLRWCRGLEIVPLIRKIQAYCERVIDEEIERAKNVQNPAEVETVRQALERMKGKFLHELLAELKQRHSDGNEIGEAFLEECFSFQPRMFHHGQEKDFDRVEDESARALSGESSSR